MDNLTTFQIYKQYRLRFLVIGILALFFGMITYPPLAASIFIVFYVYSHKMSGLTCHHCGFEIGNSLKFMATGWLPQYCPQCEKDFDKPLENSINAEQAAGGSRDGDND